MALKKHKPTSAGMRFQINQTFDDITKTKPEKGLICTLSKNGGRNNLGRITARHRGGGSKRKYRIIDFKRDKVNIPAKVEAIEYDPNRSSRIALICYTDGVRSYILAPVGIKVGDKVMSAEKTEVGVGNCMPLKNVPLGAAIHNIELREKGGAKIVRSAGSMAQIVAREGEYAQVRLPSGEVRKVHTSCRATIGQVSNIEHGSISVGKAGKTRHKGRRPHVRGVAMNPVDHPHGGGEGKASGGRHPVTPWGIPTKGKKTRHNKRTNTFIVKRRNKR